MLYEIQSMKAAILFLDGVNIYYMINHDSITGHTVKNDRRSHDPEDSIGNMY